MNKGSFACLPGNIPEFYELNSNALMTNRSFLRALIVLGTLILLMGLYYRFWFLRQPDRAIPADPEALVSPANGKVAAVVAWDSLELTLQKDLGTVSVLTGDIGPRGWLIAIEMDITNVHYQRAPLPARFLGNVYRPGAFRNALIQTNPFGFRLENEHNAMLFETSGGFRFKVVQIAGLLARRIVDYVEPGQRVERGEVIGLIKLGSQVVLILPEEVEVLAVPGQKVVDGESVLARLDPTR